MGASPQSGFALVVVIWAVGLLALMFLTYVAAARYRSIEAFSLSERTSAEALANRGVNIAILDLLGGFADRVSSSTRFRFDGAPSLCVSTDGSLMATSVSDEGGRIDLNTASSELLQAFLRGIHPDAGAILAKKFLSVREAALEAQSSKGIASTNAAAFKSILELDRLIGDDRIPLESLVSLVTVHSRNQGFDPRVAPDRVLKATSPRGRALSRSEAKKILPIGFMAESQGRAFLVSTEAMTPNGARFARDAVVEFSREFPSGYQIREWREGSLRLLESAIRKLPLC